MSEIRTGYQPLAQSFFSRRTDEVARDILGKLLIREKNGEVLAGKIVEVEAYFGEGDPASHACRGMTPRNAVMFGPPGLAYVYLNYGVHWLLNVVTEPPGRAGAVLIRAIEPLAGIGSMLLNRPVTSTYALSNGPGKLTQAMGIGPSENGADLTNPVSGLFVANGSDMPRIRKSTRVGISAGTEHLLRFYVEGSAFVSRK
ncbi:MAG: DNA-3-methyladenine glycosylase [Actinobacteria bacterium]|nr:DNA-3-methyladenine glycosylase [Actinomycetota bacterium]